MSRCHPFPPPGYEKEADNDDLGLLTKEKHKEKKKRDKDKEKKDKKHKTEKGTEKREKDKDNKEDTEKREKNKHNKDEELGKRDKEDKGKKDKSNDKDIERKKESSEENKETGGNKKEGVKDKSNDKDIDRKKESSEENKETGGNKKEGVRDKDVKDSLEERETVWEKGAEKDRFKDLGNGGVNQCKRGKECKNRWDKDNQKDNGKESDNKFDKGGGISNKKDRVQKKRKKIHTNVDPHGLGLWIHLPVLTDKDKRSIKIPRTALAKEVRKENGRRLQEAKDGADECMPDSWREATGNAAIEDCVTNTSCHPPLYTKACETNGKVDQQPSLLFVSPLNGNTEVDALAPSKSRTDTRVLDLRDTYSSSLKQGWSDVDDQDWLCQSNHPHCKSQTTVEFDKGSLTVWAQALYLQCTDMYALPYVLPL